MSLQDSWKSADAYERFMGRWSRLVARSFLDWLSPASGLRWLDVGCGSGALSEAVLKQCAPSALTAVDRSDEFMAGIERRLGNLVHCKVGDAEAIPVESESIEFAVSGLVLNFVSDPVRALVEMKRVTIPKGTVALYVWDYAGTMDLLNAFWDAAVALEPQVASLHEGRRFPNAGSESLCSLMREAGFSHVELAPIEIMTRFENFEDYWQPFLGGQGPAPTYLMSLRASQRQRLRQRLLNALPIEEDGSIPLRARAWALKGEVSQ